MKFTLKQCQEMMDEFDNLYLSGTQITELPEGLTVGGSLDLSGTQITELPEDIKVALNVYSNYNVTIKKSQHPQHGDYVPNRYLYADNILTHVKATHKVGDYTFYVGKIKGRNVLSDGTYYAHCATIKDGIQDIEFKKSCDRGIEQYKDLDIDTPYPTQDIITMYRVITGACQQGTQTFVNSLGKLKDKYTIREAIDITRGQYNSFAFEKSFL